MNAPALPLSSSGSALEAIPLVRQLLDDPGVRIVRRGIDQHWHYASVLNHALGGWHLYRPEIYTARESALAQWLDDRDGDLRLHNEGDRLMHELLFAVHDYLHAWAVAEVAHLRPQLGIGRAPITRESLEHFAFVQLLTEAAATVGLDYWYLSCVDVPALVGIGSTLRTLTVSYREEHASEYRHFNPDFAVQRPEFFTAIANFYCTGRFGGFDQQALKRSPRMLSWLKHELSYGQLQRRYTRQWLQHLAGGDWFSTAAQLHAPVSIEEPWQAELTAELGQRLWEKVKQDAPSRRFVRELMPRDGSGWQSPDDRPLDFRFTNFNALGDDPWSVIEARGIVRESFPLLANQVISAHRHAKAPPMLLRSLSLVRDSSSVDLLHHVFDHVEREPAADPEPRDLFVLS